MANQLSLWDLPDNSTPKQSETTSFYTDALAIGQDYLKSQFNPQADVTGLLEQRSYFVDQVLQHVWRACNAASEKLALVAVGGYGRNLLHPYSDVDLLILLDDALVTQPPQSLSDFLTQIWDLGLDIGYSVRSVSECRQQAEQDVTVATNLLETRLLSGEPELFSALQALTGSNKIWDTKYFYESKKQEQQQRHQKYNDTANNLEPNIKESPGGLRDLQVISWVAQQHFNVIDFDGLRYQKFLSESEYSTLIEAIQFLWRLRFALHLISGRKNERLFIDHQREIAMQFGYKDTAERLAVEQFMKDYYRCARSVQQMNELLLQLFEEEIILADTPDNFAPINARFHLHNGFLATKNASIFAFYPSAMLELFLILQQQPNIVGVRANTIRQLHAHLHLINDTFRRDIENKRLFLAIMAQPNGITDALRKMNKFGVLGAYLPVFDHIVGLMQHDLFHIYTVDEHTLFVVRNLRRFSCIEHSDEFPLCSQVFKQLEKPHLLYIAGLFHDIAKGRGGDHSELGAVDVVTFAKHHQFSKADTDILEFLVAKHLTMSATAQKSDVNDPETLNKFAEIVTSVERLNYLYLLTVADIRATNHNLWNDWRNTLLKQLYQGTKNWLEHQDEMAKDSEEKSQQRQQNTMKKLKKQGWTEQQVDAIWSQYPTNYFFHHSQDEIIWQTQARLKYLDQNTVISTNSTQKSNTLAIFIYSQNQLGIFHAVTTCLEKLQLDILDARINATVDNHSLNTYMVKNNQVNQTEIISALQHQLANMATVNEFSSVIPREMTLFETTPQLIFSNENDQAHTRLELYTHDRPGLVSIISSVFVECKINLINAKLVTLGDQVEDIFFIQNQHNQPLTPNQTKTLSDLIKQALT